MTSAPPSLIDVPVAPMLARSAGPFDSPRHLFEVKWDGTRCILFLREGKIRLQNRRLADITHRYPELDALPEAVAAREAILDGELVVFSGGLSDFRALQTREHLSDSLRIRARSRQTPATYVAFDILFRDGHPLVGEPLRRRKEVLADTLGESPHLMESAWVLERGRAFFRAAVDQGQEGAMAKALDSPYLIGRRSRHWLKIKPRKSAICHVVGYVEREDGRLSSLLVAAREGGRWVYRGRVGSGFTERDRATLPARLERHAATEPPVEGAAADVGVRWIHPDLRCEVSHQELTRHGHFRAPVFEGFTE